MAGNRRLSVVSLYTLAIAALLMLVAGLLFPAPAHAVTAGLNSISPRPANSNPNGVYTHRIRFNEFGNHNDVKLRAYYDQGVSLSATRFLKIELGSSDCDVRLKNWSRDKDKVILEVIIEGRVFPIQARNLCSKNGSRINRQGQPNKNVFYARYELPNLGSLDSNTNKHHVDIRIRYIKTNLMDRKVGPAGRNAFGFVAKLTGAGSGQALLGPRGTPGSGDRNYSILSKNKGGHSEMTIPFALPCSANRDEPNARVRVYDSDARNALFQPAPRVSIYEQGTNNRVKLENTPGDHAVYHNGSNRVMRLTAGSNETSTIQFRMESNKKYALVISSLYNGNTVDVGLPSDAIYGVIGCNKPPTGNISDVVCDPDTGRIGVRVTFRDPDATTTARILLENGSPASGKRRQTSDSGSWRYFYVPYVNPYQVQRITLQVKDTGPGSDKDFHQVDTANTKLCAESACGSSTVSPSNIDPKTRFNITVSINTSVAVKPPPINYMRLQIEPVPPATWSYSREKSSVSYSTSAGRAYATFSNIGPTNQAGNYRYNWRYRNTEVPSLGQSCGYNFGATSANFWVANMPFLKVYGGDTMAGGYQQDGVVGCEVDNSAGFYSWNNDDTPDYSGAGGQLAVLAMNFIEHFVSNLSGTNGKPPSQLSFSNTDHVNNRGQYGGSFGAALGSCDFISDAKDEGVGLPGGVLSGRTVNVGEHQTIYVENEDIFISGPVIYSGSGGSWTDATDIPSFKLVVVGGNIYIDNNVEQLDGLYVAVPDAGDNGGEIITCASGAGSPYDLSDSGAFSACNNKLRVYGSFAAKSVQFNRTWGTLGAANETSGWNNVINGNAAEVFIYTPEMWIPNGSGQRSLKYDSVIGLPPVL